jgi:hypothetical protein
MTRAGGTRRPLKASRRGEIHRPTVTPGLVILAVALLGSVIFALYAVTVRDASQIPLLASGAVAVGIAFVGLAIYSVRATWYAGVAGRNGRALSLALAGGAAAIIGSGCLAGAIILFMLSRPPG